MKTLATIAVFLTLGTFAASAQSNNDVSNSTTKVTLIDLPNPDNAEKSMLNKYKIKFDLTDAQVAELKTVLNKKETVIDAKLKQILTPAQAAKVEGSRTTFFKEKQ